MDITPFLMFTGQGDEAVNFYVSLFPNSRKLEGGAFELNGRRFRYFDSPPVHEFTFTPSWSVFVTCDSPEEVDRLFATLSEGGSVLMPLDSYDFSPRYGWVNDRFGVSWQLGV